MKDVCAVLQTIVFAHIQQIVKVKVKCCTTGLNQMVAENVQNVIAWCQHYKEKDVDGVTI